jgi:hypothetical protein
MGCRQSLFGKLAAKYASSATQSLEAEAVVWTFL